MRIIKKSLRKCACVHVFKRECVYKCVCVYMCVCVYVRVRVWVRASICTCASMCLCVYVCARMRARMRARVFSLYICMYNLWTRNTGDFEVFTSHYLYICMCVKLLYHLTAFNISLIWIYNILSLMYITKHIMFYKTVSCFWVRTYSCK